MTAAFFSQERLAGIFCGRYHAGPSVLPPKIFLLRPGCVFVGLVVFRYHKSAEFVKRKERKNRQRKTKRKVKIDMMLNKALRSANTATTSTSDEKVQLASLLPIDFTPGPYDVICAHGKLARNHEGNKLYKELIQSRLHSYASSTTKYEKTFLVNEVIESICSRTIGGFIKAAQDHEVAVQKGRRDTPRDATAGRRRWYRVDGQLIREKVGQAFRDNLDGLYKSSTRNKRRRREKACAGMILHDIDSLIRSNDEVSTCVDKLSNDIGQKRNDDGTFIVDDFVIFDMFCQSNINLLEAIKKDEDLVMDFQLAEQQQKENNKKRRRREEK